MVDFFVYPEILGLAKEPGMMYFFLLNEELKKPRIHKITG